MSDFIKTLNVIAFGSQCKKGLNIKDCWQTYYKLYQTKCKIFKRESLRTVWTYHEMYVEPFKLNCILN